MTTMRNRDNRRRASIRQYPLSRLKTLLDSLEAYKRRKEKKEKEKRRRRRRRGGEEEGNRKRKFNNPRKNETPSIILNIRRIILGMES